MTDDTAFRDFLEEHAFPIESAFLAQPFRELLPVLRAMREEVKRRGLWAPHLPKEHGGMGLSLVEFAHVSAVLGESPIGHYLFNCNAPDIGNQELLLSHGSDEQRARWFVPLARGEIRSCFAMTEPEFAGSNPVWMNTTARRDGDEYVITGHKWFTSSADGAAFTIVRNPKDELKTELKTFVVSGASKRGWTSWMTGAVDPRVKAIAPLAV